MWPWQLTNKGDQRVRALADRHYSRETPGSPQFCRPGHNLVLWVPNDQDPDQAAAAWVWWHPSPPAQRRDGHNGYHHCTLFRNESPHRSSDLIHAAVTAAQQLWEPPVHGFDTYVRPDRVRSSNPGYCYQRAGWIREPTRATRKGPLVRLYLPVARLPIASLLDGYGR